MFLRGLKYFSYLCDNNKRIKNIQKKYELYTNEHSSPLQALSYLCSRDLRGAVLSIDY
nr:MAG TPA: hypothetical protein [Caudoviricetes sp.]